MSRLRLSDFIRLTKHHFAILVTCYVNTLKCIDIWAHVQVCVTQAHRYFILKGCARVQFDGKKEQLLKSVGPGNSDARKSAADTGSLPHAFLYAGDTFGEAALVSNLQNDHALDAGSNDDDCWLRRRLDAAAAAEELTVYSLGLNSFRALRDTYPAVAIQLEEYCALRAAQARRKSGFGTTVTSGSGTSSAAEPCRLRMMQRQTRMELIRAKEVDVLQARCRQIDGDSGDTFRLMMRNFGLDSSGAYPGAIGPWLGELRNISLAVGTGGDLYYFDHELPFLQVRTEFTL